MITAYAKNGNVTKTQLLAGSPLPPGTVWIDLAQASSEEIAHINQIAHMKLPPLRDVRLLEQSRQQYTEKGVTYLTAPIIIGAQTDAPTTGALLFGLSPHLLVTLRAEESRALALFAERAQKEPSLLASPETAFINLTETVVHRLADLSELTAHELEQVGRIVFHESLTRARTPGRGRPDSWRKIMIGLGKAARLNHRLLASLTGLDRVLAFAQTPEEPCVSEASYARLRVMQADIKRLIEHSNAMINESTFLLDAIVGAISIEQNNVVKIFSMVAVILMPPTMIASIYGMNFQHMPELVHVWGYPAALIGMLISAIVPWWWFKKSGWF